MDFIATEHGFENGLGGASNSASKKDYHYVVFGRQQHPKYSGIYFEYDDQSRGAVNCVKKVTTSDEQVLFVLKRQKKIVVRRGGKAVHWKQFLKGVRHVFGDSVVQKV
jgi:hypothetical protein